MLKITREQAARIASLADEQEADEVFVTDGGYLGHVSALFSSDNGACRARFEISAEGAVS